MSQNLFQRSVLPTLVIASLLAGCSTPIQKPIEQTLPVVEFAPTSADELLARAEQATFPQSARLRIQAAEQLLPELTERAKSALEVINYDELPEPDQAKLSLLRATIADLTGQNWQIFLWLDREAVFNSNNRALQTEAHILRAKAYNRYGEYAAALDEWTTSPNFAEIEQRPELQSAIWETLLNAPTQRLITLANQTGSSELKGWLELAIIYRPGKTVEEQLNDLKNWRSNWQNHPANIYLPANLNNLQSSDIQIPDKIALLLPITGPLSAAGRAIRDGFIAAYYQNQTDSATPELFILDTHNRNIVELALEAQNQGAELIVGPLNKENVTLLKNNPPTGITVLALNSVDHSANTPNASNFFEFSLATEDEAKSVARRAHLDGHSRALIIRPDSSWGERTSSSFIDEWTKLGGDIAGESTFSENTQFSKLTGDALLVTDSQNRAKEIRRVLREKVGFEPRRREDVDMIFIPSSPEQARQLKPALSYQYAGRLPVYATASAYSGRVESSKDQDLNSLRVPVMPWYLPTQRNQLESIITKTWSNAESQYGSLYALGADAHQLYPRLQQLTSLPGSRLEGLTGWLSVNHGNHINRELIWQIFRNGKLTPLPIQKREDVLATKTTEH